jgi:uncharacterized repeat protein (TIGR01451 family)
MPIACTPGDPACVNAPTATPNLVLSKTTNAGTPTGGVDITYTLAVTNTTQGTTHNGSYFFTEVIPEYTVFKEFAAVAPTVANLTGCVANDGAGTECTIEITSPIVAPGPAGPGGPAQVKFTVTTVNLLPAEATQIVNKAYYVTPPATCTLAGSPACDPNPPDNCAGGSCDVPTICVTGEAACVALPVTEPDVRLAKSTTATTLTGGMTIDYIVKATNTTVGTTAQANYTFTEVVPANTTFVGFEAIAPAEALIGGCAANALAGTRCTITITTPIVDTAPAQVRFTVKVVSLLPGGVTEIVNRAYYDTPPANCSLPGPQVCAPDEPAGCVTDNASGITTCTPPKACITGDPACVDAPTTKPKMALSKSTEVATLTPDTDVPYTLTATNLTANTTQAADYTFYEVVPAYTTFKSLAPVAPLTAADVSISGCAPGAIGGKLCTITIHRPIVYGTPAQVLFTVTTVGAAELADATNIYNQVYYKDPPSPCSLDSQPVCNPEPPPGCDSDGVCAPPEGCKPGDPACTAGPTSLPNVRIGKSVGADKVQPGMPIVYTMTLTNTTESTAQPVNYQFTDVVPAHTTFTSVGPAGVASSDCSSGAQAGTECTITVLTQIVYGTPVEVTFTVTADTDLPLKGTVVNQAYYKTPPSTCVPTGDLVCDPNPPEGCIDGICTPPTPCALGNPACVSSDIAEADMQATGPNAVQGDSGSTVTFTTKCVNNGPDAAVNATCTITGVPTGPDTSIVCTPSSPTTLDVSEEISCDISFTLGDDPVTIYTDAASETPDPKPENNRLRTDVGPNEADMQAGGPTEVEAEPGDSVEVITYCVNNGPDAAVNATCDITVENPPSDIETVCTPPTATTLQRGEGISCKTTFTMGDDPVTITTEADSETPDPDRSNNKHRTRVGPPATADMEAGGPDPIQANPGTPVEVITTCTNKGPQEAMNPSCTVTVTNPPADRQTVCTPALVGVLGVGQSISCKTTFTMGDDPVTITTDAQSDTPDPDLTNNKHTTTVSGSLADMRSASPSNMTATVNTPVTVPTSCTNDGPQAAVNATCTVSGPPGVVINTQCQPPQPVASLGVGASINCTTTFTPADATPVTLTTTAQSQTADPKLSNNVSSVTITVRERQTPNGPATPIPVGAKEMLGWLMLLLAASGVYLRKRMKG